MIKKILLWTFVFFVGSSVSTFGREAAVVEQVIDGETVQLKDGREIRLIGVSLTPPGGHTVDQGTFGRAAYLSKRFIRSAVGGRAVILSHDTAFDGMKHKDREKRELAYVWYTIYYRDAYQEDEEDEPLGMSVEQRLLNAEIIKQGYSFADRSMSYEQRGAFIQYEKEAQEKEVGLWGSEPELYENLLERAKGARAGSVSKFVDQSTRRMSLETARRLLTELIELMPNDYRAYYERSWLGADPYNNQVTPQNLVDIEKAIELSPSNPKCYAHKHYLLRVLGKNSEASEVYKQAVRLATKFGLVAAVSYFSEEQLTGGWLGEVPEDEKFEGILGDALRAGLNEDHFLFFMARYKQFGSNTPFLAQAVFDKMMGQPLFAAFYRKHKVFIRKAPVREILYATHWSLHGWDDPEEVLREMETQSNPK